jgi:hypothetical protein
MTLYFAYGSNLNKRQMKIRCPAAKPICAFLLHDARLVFRGVADVIYEEGSVCPGAIWKITPACEEELDRYEGIRHGSYRKVYFDLEKPIRGEKTVMVYVMNSEGIMPPPGHYLDGIREGYRDFRLNQKPLNDAVEASHDKKNPSHIERQRHRRNGRPALAERPSERKKRKEAKKAKDNGQYDLDLRLRALCVYGD